MATSKDLDRATSAVYLKLVQAAALASEIEDAFHLNVSENISADQWSQYDSALYAIGDAHRNVRDIRQEVSPEALKGPDDLRKLDPQ